MVNDAESVPKKERIASGKPTPSILLLAGVLEDLLSAVLELYAAAGQSLPDDMYNEVRSGLEQVWERKGR